jgi:hypothetical protein
LSAVAQGREYHTTNGVEQVAHGWVGVQQLALQSPDFTFSNAESLMFFALG